MASKDLLRRKVWAKLRKVAVPDSRFSFDFSMFIPDFEGSSECTKRIREMDIWKNMQIAFITPDNCLIELRKWGIIDNKTQIMSTYGIKGGFLVWTRRDIPEGQEEFAATLDGAQKYAKPITLEAIKKLGRIDLVITGASAVNLEGVRYGKGHGYFDLEWGMFSSIGVIDENTPLLAVVHDFQVIDQKLPVSPYDSIADYIITPTRTIKVEGRKTKPKGILWNKLKKGMLEEMPPLHELKEMRKPRVAGR
jgi:5-formyltetrahydrofolate cyclo-ligase